jgi:murein DD-endopeptidase MepM/ murein hydrolase activator NlpD
MIRTDRIWLTIILVGLSLAGCQAGPDSVTAASPTAGSIFAGSTDGTPLPATPSPVILLPRFSPTPADSPTPTPLPPTATSTDAVQLFFPTAQSTPGSENRPPLYPIPWAISPHDHFFFARPISADYPAEPLWDFRYGGVYFGPDEVHTGIDIPAPRGTPVVAAGPGTVVWAGVGLYTGSPYNLEDPYGNAVVIRHDFGYQGQALFTVYAHMEEIEVILGQWLNTGDLIGKVGTTGFTTGPHLHFEVRLGKDDFFATRNPELWMAPAQGWGVLAGRVVSWANRPLTSYRVYARNVDTNRKWTVFTYGPSTVNSDDYYQENVVLSDLPAGVYEIDCQYAGLDNKVTLQILPGQVTYFAFKGYHGFTFDPPAPTATPTPAP